MSCIKIEKGGREYFIELSPRELQVLEAIAAELDGVIVPVIADKIGDLSPAAIYSLASRLKEKNLVERTTVAVPVIGITSTKRVIWKKNFDTLEVIQVLDSLPE